MPQDCDLGKGGPPQQAWEQALAFLKANASKPPKGGAAPMTPAPKSGY